MPTSEAFGLWTDKQSSSDVNECSRSSAKTKDSKVDRYRACDGTDVDQPLSKVFANYATREHSAFRCIGSKHESLILAQNERWRQASNMQV